MSHRAFVPHPAPPSFWVSHRCQRHRVLLTRRPRRSEVVLLYIEEAAVLATVLSRAGSFAECCFVADIQGTPSAYQASVFYHVSLFYFVTPGLSQTISAFIFPCLPIRLAHLGLMVAVSLLTFPPPSPSLSSSSPPSPPPSPSLSSSSPPFFLPSFVLSVAVAVFPYLYVCLSPFPSS